MDRITALYSSYALARQIATQLVADGFATDRVDVTALTDLGRAGAMPATDPDRKVADYLGTVLPELDDEPLVARLGAAIAKGGATVTVLPRGAVEIERARAVLRKHDPEELIDRVAPPEQQQGVFAERAAGTR